mmetsp:Transcript_33182/g.86758  ORF Transcript_33182/g.86758 Transcript_33182/m.86758 type:complete len:210 (-) Transcript_33182:289-918(-)
MLRCATRDLSIPASSRMHGEYLELNWIKNVDVGPSQGLTGSIWTDPLSRVEFAERGHASPAHVDPSATSPHLAMSPSTSALKIIPMKTRNCTNVMKLMKIGVKTGSERSSARTIDSFETFIVAALGDRGIVLMVKPKRPLFPLALFQSVSFWMNFLYSCMAVAPTTSLGSFFAFFFGSAARSAIAAAGLRAMAGSFRGLRCFWGGGIVP